MTKIYMSNGAKILSIYLICIVSFIIISYELARYLTMHIFNTEPPASLVFLFVVSLIKITGLSISKN